MHSFKSEHSFVAFIVTMLLLSYSWVFLHYIGDKQEFYLVCPFRWVTTLPCPGCGLTRATLEVLQGNFLNAITINPLVILVVPTLIISPFLLIFARKKTYSAWIKLEELLSKRNYLILLFICIILLWIYNIYNNL